MEETNVQESHQCPHPHAGDSCRHHCGRSPRHIVKIIVLFVLVIAAFVWLDKGLHFSAASDTERSMKNKVQAVFLENGQIYFGVLSRGGPDSWRLASPHYLERSPVSAGESAGSEMQTTLKKLTEDMHRPENAMYISDKNILFWQNLQNASPIAQAIMNGK